MNAALRLLASLRLESGKLWIEVATGWQLEDATAIHAPDEGGSTHRTRGLDSPDETITLSAWARSPRPPRPHRGTRRSARSPRHR